MSCAHQAKARRRSVLLFFHFGMGVLAVLGAMLLLAMGVMLLSGFPADALAEPRSMLLLSTVAILGLFLIIMVSRLKMHSLRKSGGHGIARMLGGRLLDPAERTPGERKLLNVVEEMAIAAGLPVPPVYLLDQEPGINAFVAGFDPTKAVLGVTRGAVDNLTRDQLQAVVAHEFSHIEQGDMRHNIRLLGFIHGITIIGQTGWTLWNLCTGDREPYRDMGGWALPLLIPLALALMALGYGGTFFGKMIRAAVSRDREYLADASSVRFTHNDQAVVSALEIIGGHPQGSIIRSPAAAQLSHFFFSTGVHNVFGSLMATHPDIPKRIRRIHPSWQGVFQGVSSQTRAMIQKQAELEALSYMNGHHPPSDEELSGFVATPRSMRPQSEFIRNAQRLISTIPKQLRDAGRNAKQARSAVYALLLSRISDNHRAVQDHLMEIVPLPEFDLGLKLMDLAGELHDEALLPFLDICMPVLSSMPEADLDMFTAAVNCLIDADGRTDFLEWTLQQAMMRRLLNTVDVHKDRNDGPPLSCMRMETVMLLSCITYIGRNSGYLPRDTERAFARGMAVLGQDAGALLPPDSCSLARAHQALNRLAALREEDRSLLLQACAEVVLHDDEITPREAMFLRSVAGILDIPFHPALPGPIL